MSEPSSDVITNDYQYITMIKIEDKPKTSVFAVESKHDEELVNNIQRGRT